MLQMFHWLDELFHFYSVTTFPSGTHTVHQWVPPIPRGCRAIIEGGGAM